MEALQASPLASPDFLALLSGPVFAIAVAAYLLVRIDKTLGDMRDALRDLTEALHHLPDEDTISRAVHDRRSREQQRR